MTRAGHTQQLRVNHRLIASAAGVLLTGIATANGQVYRWDNGQLIAGTENIPAVPGVNYAGLSLDYAMLEGRSLSTAALMSTSLRSAKLGGTSLFSTNFRNADLSFASFLRTGDTTGSSLHGAILEDAIIRGAVFDRQSFNSLTPSQLYSTASYRNRDLRQIALRSNDLTRWNFASQDLTNASFTSAYLSSTNFAGANLTSASFMFSNLSYADFTGAIINGAYFYNYTIPTISWTQLTTTASYQNKDLRGVKLTFGQYSGRSFASFNLSNASFDRANLSTANLTSADLTSTDFTSATLFSSNLAGARITHATFASSDLSQNQLISTASYAARDLQGVDFQRVRAFARFLNLASFDLRGAHFGSVELSGASLLGANVTGTRFKGATDVRFTNLAQFQSTADYQDRDLAGTSFGGSLSNLDVSGWNVGSVRFVSANLQSANFTGTDLTSAAFVSSALSNVRFTGANLTLAFFSGNSGASSDFTAADLRGATGLSPTFAARNAILPSGSIGGLNLLANDRLVVRDNNWRAATIALAWAMAPTSTLEVRLSDAVFNPTLVSVTPSLGGTLHLSLIPSLSPASLLNQSIDLFNWPATPLAPANRFAAVTSTVDPARYIWDTIALYTTGHIALRLIGDANLDGQVTPADQALIALGSPTPSFITGDFNLDNAVDADDLSLFDYALANTAAAPNPALPEPTLLALLPLSLTLHRHRRSLRPQE